jgi:aerobic carbon-monoxide dehydrogenase small subunit
MQDEISRIKIHCTINGKSTELNVYPMERMIDVIRGQAGLTGPKEGCGEGECGTCAVLVDGVLVNSCLIPAIQMQGTNIVTIEGLKHDITARIVQQAFVENGGIQCGFCTPGMIMASVSLLKQNPNPEDSEIKEALAGNLCRCTGYVRILSSVKKASEVLTRGDE